MRRSTDKILVTHQGNLPLPDDLNHLHKDPVKEHAGLRAVTETEESELSKRLPSAVAEVIDRQIECGIDVVNDGEFAKAGSYSTAVFSRVTGWETLPVDPSRPPKRAVSGARDKKAFPGFAASGLWSMGSGGPIRPGFATPGEVAPPATTERVCTGPVTYIGQEAMAKEIEVFKAGLQGKDVEGFMGSLGPLGLGARTHNLFYPTEEEYMMAVADAVHQEYKAITDAGLIVQVDEPEFATSWEFYPEWDVEQYREYLQFCLKIINHALEGLPHDLVRFHTCWASAHRPHVNDIPLKYIADLLVKIDADAYSIEAGNARHAHEWKVWEDVKLPEGKTLIPGVISHATDVVEHPELIAERLIKFASVLGKENVQAGADCGIGSRVGHPEIAWAKLKASGEGAAIASAYLWGRD